MNNLKLVNSFPRSSSIKNLKLTTEEDIIVEDLKNLWVRAQTKFGIDHIYIIEISGMKNKGEDYLNKL
jgi:hypothetical protein